MMPIQRIYTVAELTEELNLILEEKYSIIWITGEISNLKISVSGHCYFTLKDESAQLQSVIFRGPHRKIKFPLQDGMKITALGRLSIYPPRGNYQFIAEYVEPRGRGALQAAFEALKDKLETEGLFNPDDKKALPQLPARISLITSPTGAVRRDMETIIARRFPDFPIELVPVSVQGRDAPGQIVAALKLVGQQKSSAVVILARGGGSLEDLQAFNDEDVARAIYRCPLPVVSAVGHETDYTIADFVADLRAPTPSAAAELVVPVKEELIQYIRGLQLALERNMAYRIEGMRRQIHNLQGQLRDPRKALVTQRLLLDDYMQRAAHCIWALIRQNRTKVGGLEGILMRNPIKKEY